jgi:hypothetical protein
MKRTVFILTLLSACSKQASKEEPPVNVPPAAPSAAPTPAAAPNAPSQATLSVALFKDADLLVCTDITGSKEELDRFVIPDGGTKLSQPCASLGRPALTTCTKPNAIDHYYHVSYSDKYMAACVKNGGQWATSRTPEAELARAQQELEKAQRQ